MTKHPLVSVIVATRNRRDYLKRMLDMLFSDDYPNLEVIIIDGASTDGTVDLLKSYGDKIAKWVSEPDEGEYFAINKALHLATGDIIKWMTDDDVLRHGVFHQGTDYLEKHPEIDVVFGQTIFWQEMADGPVLIGATSCADAGKLNLRYWLREQAGVSSQASFIRRRVFDLVGPFSTEYVCGDTEWWVRAASKGVPMGVMPHVVLDYYFTGFNGLITKGRRVKMDVVRINIRYGSIGDICHVVFRKLIKDPLTYRVQMIAGLFRKRAPMP